MDAVAAYKALEAVRVAVQALHAALKEADAVVDLCERKELDAFRSDLDDLWHDHAEGLLAKYDALSNDADCPVYPNASLAYDASRGW